MSVIEHSSLMPAGTEGAIGYLHNERIVYLADEADKWLILLTHLMLDFHPIIFQALCYNRLNPVRVT